MFDLMIHSDWSVSAAKRWAATARREEHYWFLSDAEPAWPAERLIEEAKSRSVLAGFDFPIGVPAHWALRAGVSSFTALLPLLGSGEWAEFFHVAEHPTDISIVRPFYPRRSSASAKQAHLLCAMQAESLNQLRRQCELATPDRRAGCALFWTLGGNQVGKAALSGWREIVIPAQQQGARLWPFDGDIAVSGSPGLTIAETYPAEAYKHVGVIFRSGMSKRRQADRATFASILENWAETHRVALAPALVKSLRDGFGAKPDGEDRFDALLGLCGMIEVVDGRRSAGAPRDHEVRAIEGWILGQSA